MRHLPRPRPDPTAAGQESVWDYPRPAILEPTPRRLKVVFADRVVAETTNGLRVLERSHPPTYYFPPGDVASSFLRPSPGETRCEWKGAARYLDLVIGERAVARAAWSYPDPDGPFRRLRDYVAFYPGRVDGCFVDDEPARPQEGDLYGGWITSHVTGPFKGPPGTALW